MKALFSLIVFLVACSEQAIETSIHEAPSEVKAPSYPEEVIKEVITKTLPTILPSPVVSVHEEVVQLKPESIRALSVEKAISIESQAASLIEAPFVLQQAPIQVSVEAPVMEREPSVMSVFSTQTPSVASSKAPSVVNVVSQARSYRSNSTISIPDWLSEVEAETKYMPEKSESLLEAFEETQEENKDKDLDEKTVHMFGKKNRSFFQYVVALNDTIWIDRLINTNDLEINHQDDDGFTALHYAAYHLDRSVYGKLIQAGADPEIKDHFGLKARDYANILISKKITPLHYTLIYSVNEIKNDNDMYKNSSMKD